MAVPMSNSDAATPNMSELLESSTSAVNYQAGTWIYKKGDSGNYAYLIKSGYVEIHSDINGQSNCLELLGPGDIFGEMELFDGKTRTATAIAAHDTSVYSISCDQLRDEINRAGPITQQILIAAVNRLRSLQTNYPHPEDQTAEIESTPQVDQIPYKTVRMDAARQLKQRFDLEYAIKNKNFKLAYQPIVNLLDGRTAGFEALLRWPLLDNLVVTPDEFIPLAEQSKLIVPLGAWALENALQTLSLIEHKSMQSPIHCGDIFVSVNVSPRQLENEFDIEQLANLIEQANINPENVKLEITERALLSDPRMAMLALARLKSTGASIAIDDFGTGYSSLNYLHRFPLDTLKIDRSFVSRIVNDRNRQHVVAAIIGLANDLGMDVVAEGVEELDELQWLRAHSCRYAQGYLLSKPKPITEALGHIGRHFEW